MRAWWNYEAWDDLVRWGVGVAILVGLTALLAMLKALLGRRWARLAARTATRVDDVLVDLLQATRVSFLAALATLAAIQVMPVPDRAEAFIRKVVLVVSLFQAGVWGARALRELVDRGFGSKGEGSDPSRVTGARMVGFLSRVVLWTIVLLMALDNFGVNVSTLIAGLGVGGVAVALAAQNILGDLFASVSILLDKPFVVGDFIAVDTFMGAVEQIGVKTTRLRSLSGEQIVFANSDLIKSRVRNYKRMSERRIEFTFGVAFGTPPEVLGRLPSQLREIVTAQPKTRFDRAHFATIGDSAFMFSIVYFVLEPDYNLFMDTQQTINLAILKRLAEEKAVLAYPSRRIYVEGEVPTRPSAPPS